MKPIILMILSKVPSNDGEACPVAAGGCTVHTGRTLHYTGAVVSLSFCQLLFCRTRWRCKYIELRAGFGTFGPAWLHLSRPSGTQAVFCCMWREGGTLGVTEQDSDRVSMKFGLDFNGSHVVTQTAVLLGWRDKITHNGVKSSWLS